MAITIAMVMVLAGSLGLAYVLTVNPHTRLRKMNPGLAIRFVRARVEQLEVNTPETWPQARLAPAARPAIFKSAAVFANPSDARWRLMVGSLRGNGVKAPNRVLVDACHELLDPNQTRQMHSVEPIRIGTLVGQWCKFISDSDQGLQLRLIAAVTEDARQYWVVDLLHTLGTQSLDFDADQVNQLLFLKILSGTRSLAMRDAQPADTLANGMGESLIARLDRLGLQGRVDTNGLGSRGVYLTPQESPRGIGVMRMRGTVDSGITDPADPRSAAALLAQQYRLATGRAPTSRDLQATKIAGTIVYSVVMPVGDGTLVCQLCYAPLAHSGQGVLIELLCPPRVLHEMVQWVPKLITTLMADPPPPGVGPEGNPGPTGGWSAALALGQQAVDAQKAAAQQDRAALEGAYYLIHVDGQVLGYHMELGEHALEASAATGPLRWHRGRSVTVIHQPMKIQLDREWRLEQGAPRFVVLKTTRTVDRDQQVKRMRSRLVLDQGQLTLWRDLPEPQQQVWSGPAPEALVYPMMEESWPTMDDPVWEQGAVLVWLSQQSGPAQPYEVRRVMINADPVATPPQPSGQSQPQGQGHSVVLMRPMMGLDANIFWYDPDNRLGRYRLQQIIGMMQGAAIDVVRIDRDQLIERFPVVKEWLRKNNKLDDPPTR